VNFLPLATASHVRRALVVLAVAALLIPSSPSSAPPPRELPQDADGYTNGRTRGSDFGGTLVEERAQGATAPTSGEVVHVRIDGPLDVGTKSLLRRAIREAKQADGRLVIELDTPGGEIELMWQLAQQIADASDDGLLTVCWVNDKALSAGALLAIACERIYMKTTGVIGAAMPVVASPGGGIMEIPDPGAREKVSAAVRKSFHAFAQKRKRPTAIAEAMVDPSVGVRQVREKNGELRLITFSEWDDLRVTGSGDPPELVRTIATPGQILALSGTEAVELGLADGIADSLNEVLEKIGSRSASTQSVKRASSEDLAALLDSLKIVLLVAGLIAAYVEIKAPGFGLPGIVAIACFGLLLFGRWLVGLADIPHIVAVVVGVILIAVEIFLMPGTLWPGLLGGLLVIGGLVFAHIGPDVLSYPLTRELAIDEAFRLALGVLAAAVGAWVVARFLPKAPIVSRMVLAPGGSQHGGAVLEADDGSAGAATREGRLGRAVTDLRPVGKVVLDHDAPREQEARASGSAIDRGARVRVVEVQTGRLVVEAVRDEQTSPGRSTDVPA
jgi:membrane-bound serine protease (ClpP class)